MATSKTIYDPRRFVPTTSTDTDVAVPVTNASNMGFVALQPASPGTAQTGVANITKLLVGPVGDGTTPVTVTTDGGNAATFGNGATTGGIQLFLSNASGNVIFGVIDSLNTFVSGGVAYAGFVGTNIGKPFYIVANGTAAIGIDTSQVATFVNPFKITGTGGANQVLQQATSGGAITVGQLATTNLSDVTAWTAFTPSLAASAGTWSGTVTTASYALVGKTIFVQFVLTASSVSAAPNSLKITIPGSLTAAATSNGVVLYSDNGTTGSGLAVVSSGGTVITLFKDVLASGNWTTSVANSVFELAMTFPVQ